ncbi:MAG TPA: winged helix-turn-helix domain-containing protein [Kofleriaceae bacterium]|nr:winged helix-turn-helix domain-containing protein [Kofleriaceae bacterium]
MSTLAVVEEILRETAVPMSVREIVERAGARLPSKSKTPDTVVARDLSMDIKKKGEASLFIRTSPGRYTLRSLATGTATVGEAPLAMGTGSRPIPSNVTNQTQPMAALGTRKPAAAATSQPTRSRTDSDVQGGGFVG